jgi:tyrosyl-tRNA synthetase
VPVAQTQPRDACAKRYASDQPIYLHECLYPLMQAWDSVMIKSDIELGGTEQLYSFMLARDLQKEQQLPQQVGVMSPILVGLDGVKRMGKSLGNYIGIAEPAYEQMKKFMQLSDAVMPMYYELLTTLNLEEAKQVIINQPKQAKVELAKNVITQYHGSEAADEAALRWDSEIGGGGLPTDIPDVEISLTQLQDGKMQAVELLAVTGMSPSKGEGRRLIAGGGMKLGDNRDKVDTFDQLITITDGLLIFAGKKKYCRIKLK